MESARTRLVLPLKLVAIDLTEVAVFEMKSLTCTDALTPFSVSSVLAGRMVPKFGHAVLVTPAAALNPMTRANELVAPPSPMKEWVKLPEFRTNVVSRNDRRSKSAPIKH